MELVKEITRRGHQVFVIDFTWLDSHGKRRRYRRDAEIQGKTAAQVEAKRRLTAATFKGSPFAITDAAAERAEVDNTPPPAPPAPTSPTLDSCIATYWSTCAVTQLKASSRETYRTQLDFWIAPVGSGPRPRTSRKGYKPFTAADGLGHLPIASIDLAAVEDWDARMVQAGASRVSRRLAQIVLRSIVCKWAVKRKLLAVAPTMPQLPSGSKKTRFAPTAAQTETILAHAGSIDRQIAILLGVDAGLRTCEIKALRVSDLDLGPRRRLTIREAKVGQTTDTPKSHAERRIPLTERLHTALSRACANRAPSAFVTVSGRGTQWGEGTIREMLIRVCVKAGLPRITTHHLRHAFATSVLRAGAPLPVVQRLLGHASITTTVLYEHCDESDETSAIAALQTSPAHMIWSGKNAVTAPSASV